MPIIHLCPLFIYAHYSFMPIIHLCPLLIMPIIDYAHYSFMPIIHLCPLLIMPIIIVVMAQLWRSLKTANPIKFLLSLNNRDHCANSMDY